MTTKPLPTVVRQFLTQDSICANMPDPDYQEEYPERVLVFIEGLKGCVNHSSNQWEKLQILFVRTSGNQPETMVIADGWTASGIRPPRDSAYVTPIPGEVMQRFTNGFRVRLAHYIADHTN